MKNKKGFTLIELLAVIVVLAIIMVIAVPNVISSINSSKDKAKYIAAKEIVGIAEVYFATNNITGDNNCVEVNDLEDYLESDVTNPETGENISDIDELKNQKVCINNDATEQRDYKINDNLYFFDGYTYKFNVNNE